MVVPWLYCNSFKTPKKGPSNKSNSSSNSTSHGSTGNNKDAKDSIKGIEGMFEKVITHMAPPCRPRDDDTSALSCDVGTDPRVRKRKCLEDKKNLLMEQIKFYKDLGKNYEEKFNEYSAVCNELNNIVAADNES